MPPDFPLVFPVCTPTVLVLPLQTEYKKQSAVILESDWWLMNCEVKRVWSFDKLKSVFRSFKLDDPIIAWLVGNNVVPFYSSEMVHFGGGYAAPVNCAWWDHKMHSGNTFHDGKWHVNGLKHKTEWVTWYPQKCEKLDFMILPKCTLVSFRCFEMIIRMSEDHPKHGYVATKANSNLGPNDTVLGKGDSLSHSRSLCQPYDEPPSKTLGTRGNP